MNGIGLDTALGAQSIAQSGGDITNLITARLMAQRIAAAQQQAAAMDATGTEKVGPALAKSAQDTFIAGRKAMDPTEDRILKRDQGAADLTFKREQEQRLMGVDAETGRHNVAEESLTGSAQAETGRHDRADEGLRAKQIDVTGANRTVQVRTTDPDTGRETIEFLTPQEARARGAMQAPPTAGQKKAIADAQASEEALNNIQTLYKPEYVGPMAGRMGSFENYTGIGITPERAQFTSAVAALKNQVIHDITGAQMSQGEASRILASVPDVTNPPEVFQARMTETMKNRERIRQAMGGRAPISPVGAPSALAPAATPASTSAYDLYLQRLKGGG